MKNNIVRFTLMVALFSSMAACQKESDTDPGGGPSALDRDKFIGSWNVASHHTITTVTQYWTLTIMTSSTASKILLDNFDQMGTGNYITATVSGDTFTIPIQTVGENTYQGNGSYSNNQLSFTYTVDDQANPVDSVSATATR